MNNELISEKSWWKRNWKWFLATIALLFSIAVTFLSTANIDKGVLDVVRGYSDSALYEKAIEKAKTNERILEVLGDLQPIDPLSIVEGNTKYSNNSNSVALSIRIKGSKGSGKMDAWADKKGAEWEYKKICIRIKHTKEEIQIVE